ncbi:MAG: sodium:solute symporter, partial [Candidatus Aureabacteria bacterium]|nr:sodium:solute symporter [Candidatus Auribacterota bacterium]
GLMIAAIFAAAMSTVSSSLNCAATLTLYDLYRRFLRPAAGERESMGVLYLGTLLWGVVGTGTALAMIRIQSALDAWWRLSGIFSGGVLGLFLIGYLGRRATNTAAIVAVGVGVLLIGWMTLSPLGVWCPARLRYTLNQFMIPVFGTTAIIVTGFLLAAFLSRGSRRLYF